MTDGVGIPAWANGRQSPGHQVRVVTSVVGLWDRLTHHAAHRFGQSQLFWRRRTGDVRDMAFHVLN
jgi:hypothetical protein